ncbi:MAG: cell division protein SepF [Eubacterium sp.]|nr:cell division protein SepF [Eubacterium sp.]MBR6171722.1 cell division protein SepF [Eubacterium sp.]
MAKGKKSFLDYFRVSDDEDDYDEETDDLFDEEDDDDDEGFSFRRKKKEVTAQPPEEPAPRPQYSRPAAAPAPRPASSYQPASTASYTPRSTKSSSAGKKPRPRQEEDPGKLVSFDNQRRRNLNPSSEVYVIKPQEFDDAQTVTDLLKGGKTIVINMEGVEIDPAQRIIDFIGGACYGLGGDLRAISASIFIAAPHNIEVSGDLRDEILNESTLSPQLGKY